TERDEIRAEIDKASKALQRITFVKSNLFFFLLLVFIFIRTKSQASIDQHQTYQKTIRDARETVKKNDRAYNTEVKKRDAVRADIASLKLKVNFFIFHSFVNWFFFVL